MASVKTIFKKNKNESLSFYGWDDNIQVQFQIRTKDGTELFYRQFQPLSPSKRKPDRLMLIVHGWNEHSGNYAHIASFFVRQGYSVIVPDLRGHGISGGIRGHVDEFSDFSDDLMAVLTDAMARFKKAPVHVVAHGTGAIAALNFIQNLRPGRLQNRIQALVLSGPLLDPAGAWPAHKRALGHLTGRLLPTLPVPEKVNPRLLTSDPKRLNDFYKDDLRHGKISARFLIELENAAEKVTAAGWITTVPILIVQGGNDTIAGIAPSRNFLNKVRSPNKQMHLVPGAAHEVFNEKENRPVLDHCAQWLERL